MKSLYTYFKKLTALFLTGLFLLYTGCFNDDKKDAAARLTEDLARIDQYLADNKIDSVQQDASGRIRYVIHTAGTGAQPTLESCITARFKGKYLENDSTFAGLTTCAYPMAGDLIEGWKIGIPQLHQGDSATLYIPSGLAYGPTGLPLQNIPPDAIVYFQFKLLRVGEKYSPDPSPTGSCQ
jgi:FKBP-type peptidyl-prolyl cis-trans isomerase